ncbi:MAG TPA: SDR family NAD(P)-dependent oxidoreductase [Polyangia bacterium]|nr:SDR family NAD(P)-dependent oxidoreductase [Polyangia bacterium]
MPDLKPTALLTGANRGLGLETGRQLAGRGFRLLLTSRDARAGQAAVARLEANGAPVEHRILDVTDAASIAALAGDLTRAGTRVDVLVNNAGISLQGFDAEVARQTLEVNFFGAMNVTDALLPSIPDGGNVVMVSSGMGELSGVSAALRSRLLDPRLTRAALVDLMRSFVRDVERGRHAEAGWPSSAYRVSKVGLNTLVRLLARELAPRRIRVNAVCPGWVRTDMGGAGAARGVEKGAASIVWAATLGQSEGAPTGGFFRDGRAIPW